MDAIGSNVKLPQPTPSANQVAKLSTGLAVAVAALIRPEFSLAAPLMAAVFDHLISRPQRIIENTLRSEGICELTEEQVIAFMPMSYRIIEAAKQGEYDHILKLLATFMASELKTHQPQPASLLAFARRIEGLGEKALQTAAAVSNCLKAHADEAHKSVTAGELTAEQGSLPPLSFQDVEESLNDLSGRGFFVSRVNSGWGSSIVAYKPTKAFFELLDQAMAITNLKA